MTSHAKRYFIRGRKQSLKFSINQSELQNALSVVLKGVKMVYTPYSSGVYLEVKGDVLTLQTTDLELSVQYTVAALVEEEGRAVVPGKLFTDIVNLPDAAVHVLVDEEGAVITCDTASFSMFNPEDFPGFPHVDVTQKIEIPLIDFLRWCGVLLVSYLKMKVSLSLRAR